MSDFRPYRRSQIAELRPYEDGEDMANVSISQPDKLAGSPKAGDMIARNPKNHADQWLVAAQYFADNFEAALKPDTDAPVAWLITHKGYPDRRLSFSEPEDILFNEMWSWEPLYKGHTKGS